MPTIHLIIRGRVQGVFYRASAKDEAQSLGLTGWVKNTKQGDVEIMVSGNDAELGKFTDWCRKGPSQAVVTHVFSQQLADEQVFKGFTIVR